MLKQLFIYFWSEIFTFINHKMHTFDLLIVKGDTLRLLIIKWVTMLRLIIVESMIINRR